MKITKTQESILNLFRKNVFLSKTIRELSIILKKDYPSVYNSVQELSKSNILKIKRVGNAKICEISLKKESISILSFLDEQEAFLKNIKNIDKILDFEEFFGDIIIVAGSYAKNKETKESDIDLVIITKEDVFKKQKILENLTLAFSPEIHAISLSYKDFIEMLLSKEQNFGKEAFNNRLIFRNAEVYYLLIKKAIENGFRS